MLRTKCILLPPTNTDGLRISVMSRHTLSDGVTPDLRISPDWSYDLWLKSLAPPDTLVGSFYRKEINFSQYGEGYRVHLQKDLSVLIIKEIARYARHKRVTLLCVELLPTLCHRTILLYECWRYEPGLHIQNF